MQSRDRTEIICQILEVASGSENITMTKIMYKAFLSYKQVKEYLALLIERGLVSYDHVTQTYKTTKMGLRLLQLCNQLGDMMEKGSQPQRRQ
jgi:predicted transcriptional regulator